VLEEFTVKKPTAEQLREWFENTDFVQYKQDSEDPNQEYIILGGKAEHGDFAMEMIIVRNPKSGTLFLMFTATDNEDYSFSYGDTFIIKEATFIKRLVNRTLNDEVEFGVRKSVNFQGRRESQYSSVAITFWGREE